MKLYPKDMHQRIVVYLLWALLSISLPTRPPILSKYLQIHICKEESGPSSPMDAYPISAAIMSKYQGGCPNLFLIVLFQPLGSSWDLMKVFFLAKVLCFICVLHCSEIVVPYQLGW